MSLGLPGMETLGDIEVSLLQELANEENSGGRSVPGHIILRRWNN